jgi:predicted HTH domain antitoxin
MNNVHIEFDLPANLAIQAGLDTDEPAGEVRRALAPFLYEHGRLSLGKACELGNMSYWEFADLTNRLGIAVHYSEENLVRDRDRLADGLRIADGFAG